MKLRIRSNSIRVRLTQGEVRQLAETGEVGETLGFPGGGWLVYTVMAGEGTRWVTATFNDGLISIHLPATMVREWAEGEAVSIRGEVPVEEDATLSILVEKDFECLHRNPSKQDEDADTFPHPRKPARDD